MLNELLYYLGAKQQYEGQKSQGMAGLLFLAITFMLVWKWNEWVYPVLNWSGLVSLADRIGLISEYPQATLFNVLSMIFLLAFSFAVILAVVFAVGLLLAVLGSSKIGKNLMAIVFGIVFFIPIAIMVYKNNPKRKQTTQQETPGEKAVREYQEKEDAKEAERMKDFNENPIVPATPYSYGRELNQFHYMTYDKFQYFSESIHKTINNLDERINLLQKVELQLEDHRDTVLAYNRLTGRFHFLFPNPLPYVLTDMYMESFDDEGVLLEAMKRYQNDEADPLSYMVPSLLMEFQIEHGKAYLLPAAGAEITPFNIADADNITYSHLKYNMMLEDYTYKAINARMDYQALMDRINTNAYTLKTIVDSQGVKSKSNQAKPLSDNMNQYEAVYAGQVIKTIQKFNALGYNWSVKYE